MIRALLPLALLPGCVLDDGAPLAGDWSGQMDVAVLDDARTFTIAITELDTVANCADDPDNPDGCVNLNWVGTWQVYEGAVEYGGDAALSGTVQVLHCSGGDCEALDVEGNPAPVGNGYLNVYSSWSDGQSITLEATANEDARKISGDATYGYAGGAMTGTFELSRQE